jgi:serine protease Do
MDLYNISKINIFHKKKKNNGNFKSIAFVMMVSIVFGFISGAVSSSIVYYRIAERLNDLNNGGNGYIAQTDQETAVINTVEQASEAVVSIIITKDVPILEQYLEIGPFGFTPQVRQKGTEKQEVGGGTGFIVSKDGLVLTNKHVVIDDDAEYTVFTNSGEKFPAKVLAKDPYQDIAILKIDQENNLDDNGNPVFVDFPILNLGDSETLQSGQTVIAIGNALAEFKNTVSSGVISGLGRKITASGGDFVETLEDIIQTDAAINKGNSGGPLLNLRGEVIGINTAIANDAQSIGFAIPINKAKRAIEQVKETGKIVYPFIGVRYVLINEQVKKDYNLTVDYGALIIKGDGEPAIVSDSPAAKAGLKENDIILELNNEKITVDNTLAEIIMNYNPRDEVVLRVLRGEEYLEINLVLDEKND